METKLRQIMPVYAKSVFGPGTNSKLVGGIEIIGSASPTYGGKAIKPGDLSPEARTALNYNLDLSYRRARSIFQFVSDTTRMRFTHQKDFVKNLGVAGRSYLGVDDNQAQQFAGVEKDVFCSEFNCDAHQSVILRFNLQGAQ
ncbi:MAG: microtubule-binding protein, partial [Gammaproteobacteria bacterium]|nr:microtubule-binding protein [Gammaproteobacteria bacterium]